MLLKKNFLMVRINTKQLKSLDNFTLEKLRYDILRKKMWQCFSLLAVCRRAQATTVL